MNAKQPIEIVFYLHGVTPEKVVTDHQLEYQQLHTGITEQMPTDSHWPTQYGQGEWGWNFNNGPLNGHEALATAQQKLGDEIFVQIDEQRDFTLNPLRLTNKPFRQLLFYGFSDMFYYVSDQGKWSVRYAIAEQLINHIEKIIEQPIIQHQDMPDISLTLLGHSAGSVIALDFCEYLFSEYDHWTNNQNTHYTMKPKVETALQVLRDCARQNKLQIKRLITFGSPISMLAMRDTEAVNQLANGDKLAPASYGLTTQIVDTTDINGPRWINYWDKDDLIAWPISPLFADTDNSYVTDIGLDISDSMARVHNKYWTAKDLHRSIAQLW